MLLNYLYLLFIEKYTLGKTCKILYRRKRGQSAHCKMRPPFLTDLEYDVPFWRSDAKLPAFTHFSCN